MLSNRDGLSLERNGLRAATRIDTTALRRLIHGAVQASLGRGLGHDPGGALAITRPSGKRPLSVLVTPVCANARLFPEPGAAAVVFISDPEAAEEPQETLLQRLYGLSGAEAGVAALLIQGKTPQEIQEELAISRNTVKTQLKNIFEKTGTRRQAELVRLLLRSPVGLSIRQSENHHPFG